MFEPGRRGRRDLDAPSSQAEVRTFGKSEEPRVVCGPPPRPWLRKVRTFYAKRVQKKGERTACVFISHRLVATNISNPAILSVAVDVGSRSSGCEGSTGVARFAMGRGTLLRGWTGSTATTMLGARTATKCGCSSRRSRSRTLWRRSRKPLVDAEFDPFVATVGNSNPESCPHTSLWQPLHSIGRVAECIARLAAWGRSSGSVLRPCSPRACARR